MKQKLPKTASSYMMCPSPVRIKGNGSRFRGARSWSCTLFKCEWDVVVRELGAQILSMNSHKEESSSNEQKVHVDTVVYVSKLLTS